MCDKQLCDRLKVTRYPFGLYLTNMGFYARRADVILSQCYDQLTEVGWCLCHLESGNALAYSGMNYYINKHGCPLDSFRNKFQWILNRNKNIFFEENASENVAKMSAVLRIPQCRLHNPNTDDVRHVRPWSVWPRILTSQCLNENETLPPSSIADKFNAVRTSRKWWQRDFCDALKNTPLDTNIVAAHWRLRAR